MIDSETRRVTVIWSGLYFIPPIKFRSQLLRPSLSLFQQKVQNPVHCRNRPVSSERIMLFSFQTFERSPLLVSRRLPTSRSLALDITRALFYLLATVSSDFANCTGHVLGLVMSTRLSRPLNLYSLQKLSH